MRNWGGCLEHMGFLGKSEGIAGGKGCTLGGLGGVN